MAWLAGWSHRKTVTITGQSGAGTDYQVNLSIGDASGGDFHLENHCTSFPNDITVTDNDQTTLLDHWVEDLTVDPISMWVEVADDLGSNVDVYIYYDKSGESSVSNIDNTFLFGDNFPGSSVDLTKWDVVQGTIVVENGYVKISGDKDEIRSDSTFSSPLAIRFRFKMVSAALYHHSRTVLHATSDYKYATTGDGYEAVVISNYYPFSYSWVEQTSGSGVTVVTGTASVDTTAWHIYDFMLESGNGKGYIDNVLDFSDADASLTSGYIFLASVNSSSKYWGWILVRNYNDPEPAFSSVGSEESAPVGAIMNQFQGANIGADLYNGALLT